MYTLEVDKTLLYFLKTFYQIGLWQYDEESEGRKKWKKIFYVLFGALFPIYLAINAFICVDRNESIFSAYLAIQEGVVYVKCLYLIFKKPQVLVFLYNQFVVHVIENREEFEQSNKKIQLFMKIVRAFMQILSGSNAVLVVVSTFTGDKGLPLFVSFSWSDSNFFYWTTYLCISLSLALYVTATLITPIIGYIMLNFTIAYKLLGNKLRDLGVKKQVITPTNFRSAPRNIFVENLIVFIKLHRNLTETVERFKSCFSTLFLAQITTSAVAICGSIYCLAFTSQANIFQTEMLVVILLYSIFDIFLVMHLANEITAASDQLSSCLFASNWIEQTESHKKYVLILGEVLNQPKQLVVLIYPLNLKTFTSIVNGAYSMLNILKSME